jgi:TolB-like protein
MQFRPQRVGFRGLAAAVAFLCLAPGLGIAATANPKLLLLPIVVHSAEDPEYLRDGLYDMLTARFSRIGALDLVARSDSDQGTTDLTRALKLARKAGADFVLYGSFTRFGKGASLDVQCLATDENATHAPLREIFVHSGSIGEIIPDLDELAGKVSRFARGEIIPPASPAPADFAPASRICVRAASRASIRSNSSWTSVVEEAGETSADLDGSIKELR